MFKTLLKAFFGLVDEAETQEQLQAWRRLVGRTVAITVLVLGFVAVAVLAVYDVAPFGHYIDGFARVSDVRVAHDQLSNQLSAQIGTVQTQVQALQNQTSRRALTQVRRDLLDAITKDCAAKNSALRQAYGQSIDDLSAEYQRLTGQQYQPLPCSLVVGQLKDHQ